MEGFTETKKVVDHAKKIGAINKDGHKKLMDALKEAFRVKRGG